MSMSARLLDMTLWTLSITVSFEAPSAGTKLGELDSL